MKVLRQFEVWVVGASRLGMYVHMHVHECIQAGTNVCDHMYVCIYAHENVYVFMYICICEHVHT
jgi:hypothetical protein